MSAITQLTKVGRRSLRSFNYIIYDFKNITNIVPFRVVFMRMMFFIGYSREYHAER